MIAAAVDIGTNSTRLLVTDRGEDLQRTAVVTGLGRGVAETGRLSADGIAATCSVLADYAAMAQRLGVERIRAVTTAAARRAENTEAFLDLAEAALGVRPEVVSEEEEARLSYLGAATGLPDGHWTVVDIGGGSTEVVDEVAGRSFPIGSVLVTEGFFGEGPEPPEVIEAATEAVHAALTEMAPATGGLVGVAGTWTSLATIHLGVAADDTDQAHHLTLTAAQVGGWVEELAAMSVSRRSTLPGLDPARGPVILGGAVVAGVMMERLGSDRVLVSVRDSLDGLVASIDPYRT